MSLVVGIDSLRVSSDDIHAAKFSPSNRERFAIIAAVRRLNAELEFGPGTELVYSVDTRLKQVVIWLVDRTTKETIRRVLPDEVLGRARMSYKKNV
jgi:uncharacterized FlaG/YvyC family protein